jgi:hypothetical protein
VRREALPDVNRPVGVDDSTSARQRVWPASVPLAHERTSARVARAELGQPSLGALQLALELFQAGARADSPPVVLGAHEGDPIMAVAHFCACQLEFAGGAHDLITTVC